MGEKEQEKSLKIVEISRLYAVLGVLPLNGADNGNRTRTLTQYFQRLQRLVQHRLQHIKKTISFKIVDFCILLF